MKTSKYISIAVLSTLVAIGFAGISSTIVFAEEASLPVVSGSVAAEMVVPVLDGSNNPEQVTPVIVTPIIGGTNDSEAPRNIPEDSGANGHDAGTILPNPQGSNGDEGSIVPPVIPPVVPPVTPPGGGGGSYSGGSSSSGGYTLLALANPATSSCPLLTTYIKIGANNNAVEVAKLQSFLNAFQGSNIAVNGTYDQASQNAVRAFQSKYLSDVMGPWGASQSSGYVYITTLKKINQLACKSPFVLSANDQAIIAAYKTRLATGAEGVSADGSTTGPVLETGSTTPDQGIGSNVGSSQTAAVGGTSFLARFWNFIVSLFK